MIDDPTQAILLRLDIATVKLLRRSLPVIEQSFRNEPLWPNVPYHHGMPFGLEQSASANHKLEMRWRAWLKTLDQLARKQEVERAEQDTIRFYTEYLIRLAGREMMDPHNLNCKLSATQYRPRSSNEAIEISPLTQVALFQLRQAMPTVEASLADLPVWPDVPYHHGMPFGFQRRLSDPNAAKFLAAFEREFSVLPAADRERVIFNAEHDSDNFYKDYLNRLVSAAHHALTARAYRSHRSNRVAQSDAQPN